MGNLLAVFWVVRGSDDALDGVFEDDVRELIAR